MSLASLIALSKFGEFRRYRHLVQEWWPKPVITSVQNVNSGCLHKYQCTSFSSIGFHSRKKQVEGLPANECFAYGESPQQAYDQWCELFNAWNKKEQWVK